MVATSRKALKKRLLVNSKSENLLRVLQIAVQVANEGPDSKYTELSPGGN